MGKRNRGGGFSGRKWPQLQGELTRFIALLRRENVRSYLEVGALYGDTFHAVGTALGEGARAVAVDLPGTKHGVIGCGRHKDSGQFLIRAAVALRGKGVESHVLIGDSHEERIIRAAGDLGPFDAVFIDGDHTFEGAMADWRHYGPMGRIVAFHDINAGGRLQPVRDVWEQARADYPWKEIGTMESKGGIGVLWRG